MAGARPVRLVAGFVLALALLGGVAWSGWRHIARMQEAEEWVALTHDLQASRNLLLPLVLEIESNLRSYVLTGLPEFLDEFEKAATRLPLQERRLEELTRDERQKAALSALKPLMAERITIARRTVELRHNSGAEAAAQAVATQNGRKLTDEILARLALMDALGAELLDERAAAARREAGTTALLTLTGTALSFGLLITVFALMLRENRLEQRVQERTADLSAELTTRRAAEAKLRTSEGQLRDLVDGTGDLIQSVAPNGRILFTNRAWREKLGYSETEIAALNIFDIIHPNSRAHCDATFQRLMQGEHVGVVMMAMVTKDGRRIELEGGLTVRMEDGNPASTRGLFRDVTERKRMEAALLESEERMRLATDAASIGVWDWDVKTGAIKWDERSFALYGLAPTPGGVASYQDWRAAVLPEDIAEQEAVLQTTVATGGRSQREFRIVRASDGVLRVMLAAEMAVAGDDGQTARVVGINLDITQRKQAEDLIAQLNVALSERAAKLEEANQELESFSYSVSHDLRAPLRHVQGYVEMLQRATDGQLSDQALRYLNTISAASVEMSQLIDDLLAFSRMGRTEMVESRVDTDQLVLETIRGEERLAKGRTIVWQVAPLPPVVGDPSMLKQVLINLIGNAVKYSSQRDPARIEIGCAGEEDGRVILFVRDNGAGFDMQYAHKLFGVFQRLHRAEEFEGTGIGLATVRRIVARHGGRVWAEGALNQGATFYFTLKPSQTA